MRSFVIPLRYLLICLILGTALHTQAQVPALFTAANKLYEQKQYAEAATKYQQLIDSGYQVADLYYNAGNAYYKSNQTGMAVYSFEKALSLKPGDEEIEKNLALANQQVGNNIESLPLLFFEKWWLQLQVFHTPAGWAIGSIVTFWLVCGLLICWLFVPGLNRKPIRWGMFAAEVLFVIYIAMAIFMQNKAYSSDSAVVMKTVKVKAAPDEGSKDIFEIKEGIKIKVLDSTKDFSKIQLTDGKTGWIGVKDIRNL